MATASMTFGAAGNVRTSGSLAESGTDTDSLDYSSKLEGQVTVKNTPGASVSATRGVRVDFFPRYGSSVASTTIPAIAYTLPSAAASTAESKTFYLGTGKWDVKVTNLDATHAVTVEITDATVDGIA
jgi:hypothetical protein